MDLNSENSLACLCHHLCTVLNTSAAFRMITVLNRSGHCSCSLTEIIVSLSIILTVNISCKCHVYHLFRMASVILGHFGPLTALTTLCPLTPFSSLNCAHYVLLAMHVQFPAVSLQLARGGHTFICSQAQLWLQDV